MNFVDGAIDDSATFKSRDFSVALTGAQLNKINTRAVTFGIRPEDVHVWTESTDGALPATVYVTEQMGNETLVVLLSRDLKLMARAPADFRVAPEARVWFTVDAHRAHFFDVDTGQRL